MGKTCSADRPDVPDILGSVALAAAIAFGFGAQGVARDIVEKAYERCDEVRPVLHGTSLRLYLCL